MLLLLALQLAAAAPPDTATYATPAVRAVVTAAAEANRRVPAALRGYEASVESEVAIVSRRDDGAEVVASVEQMASRLRWERPGDFEQRVVGYRSQMLGFSISTLGLFDQGWIVPSLYGNRMALFFGRDTARARRGRDGTRRQDRRRRVDYAVHPFAEDRERVYRYAGGDTVATVRVDGREIPIVRVLVSPREGLPERTFTFRGEVDVDAARHHIVRMRGQFLVTDGRPGVLGRLRRTFFTALAFAELENQEVWGRYWLPAFQRLELQGGLTVLGEAQGIVRIVSRIRDVTVQEAPGALPPGRVAAAPDSVAADTLAADTLVASVHRLTVAGRDTLEAYDDWQRELGAHTATMRAEDFLDVAPPRLRPTGEPRMEPHVERISDLFHYNRIEGPFTGLGARVRFRDAAPGLRLVTVAGWSWAERTVRGRMRLDWERSLRTWSIGAGRSLDLTNDFRTLYDSGSTLAALLASVDDYDYVDRRTALVGLVQELPGRLRLRLSAGAARDDAVVRQIGSGVGQQSGGFRPNRGIREGGYALARAALELDPDVRAEFLRPGVGGALHYERGDGGLEYQRLEARFDVRRAWGARSASLFATGGVVTGSPIPPQHLFELGGTTRLSGYEYKEFAGDRAAMIGAEVQQGLPLLRAPLRVRVPFWRTVTLPAPAPALALGVEAGWADATAAGLEAIRGLGLEADPETGELLPLSRPTARIPGSVELRLRFFGGGISIGVARAFERDAGFRVLFGT